MQREINNAESTLFDFYLLSANINGRIVGGGPVVLGGDCGTDFLQGDRSRGLPLGPCLARKLTIQLFSISQNFLVAHLLLTHF